MSSKFTILKRCFSLNSPTTNSAPYIDFTFSDRIFRISQQKVDDYSQRYLENVGREMGNVEKVKEKIKKVRRSLNNGFRSDVRLVPIGSAANHLLSCTSDLDLVLLPSKDEKEWRIFTEKFQNNMEFRIRYMQHTEQLIRKGKIGGRVSLFYKPRIPIVRFFSHGLQVDIQFGNVAPIRSSLFVRTCVETDERVALLIHWLTARFQSSGLLNSHIRLFARYHINILVIHFLQSIPYPVLPDVIELSPWLQKRNDWNNSVTILSREGSLYVPWSSQNEQTIGELALQLVDYYTQINFEKYGIDTRGRVILRSDNDPQHFQLFDEYFTESTCRVQNAPFLLKQLFEKLKKQVEQGDFEKLFRFYTGEKNKM